MTQQIFFRARDLSEEEGRPAFDVLFHDTKNSKFRYSIEVWDTREDAEAEAAWLEAEEARPVEWEEYRGVPKDTVWTKECEE